LKTDPIVAARLAFLCRVVEKEANYLHDTDGRLFRLIATPSALDQLEADPLLSERLEAFVSRFSRLQDTLADKLLPTLLDAMAEPRASALENLDRAEKLGWIDSADDWLGARRLRNLMVHEYIEDRQILFGALTAGHRFVPTLVATARGLCLKAGTLLQPDVTG
jgi:hypothetical protein